MRAINASYAAFSFYFRVIFFLIDQPILIEFYLIVFILIFIAFYLHTQVLRIYFRLYYTNNPVQ